MTTPDESAERVLEGVLGQKRLTFAEFRKAMYDEHPTYLTDEQLHDLFIKHVVRDQAVDIGPAIDFIDKAIPPVRPDSLSMAEVRKIGALGQQQAAEEAVRLRLLKGAPLPPSAQKKSLADTTLAEVAEGVTRRVRAAINILRGTPPHA